MIVAALPDEFLLTINSLEILGIIYLAIAVSKLRSEIAHIMGRIEQRDRDQESRSEAVTYVLTRRAARRGTPMRAA